MQDYQELTPDAETFRRVWQRVMPDAEHSPIVVHSPGKEQGKQRAASVPPRPQPQPQPQPKPEEPAGDESGLRKLLQELDEGLGTVAAIVRRQPGAWPLRDSIRKSAAQVRAAWFLLTGRRWNRPQGMGQGGELGALLRRQYVWEIRFSQLCRELEQTLQAGDLREILPELEGESRRRRSMIRSLLGRT